MKPHATPSEADDLFRARLDQILDRSHALVKLADADKKKGQSLFSGTSTTARSQETSIPKTAA